MMSQSLEQQDALTLMTIYSSALFLHLNGCISGVVFGGRNIRVILLTWMSWTIRAIFLFNLLSNFLNHSSNKLEVIHALWLFVYINGSVDTLEGNEHGLADFPIIDGGTFSPHTLAHSKLVILSFGSLPPRVSSFLNDMVLSGSIFQNKAVSSALKRFSGTFVVSHSSTMAGFHWWRFY